MSKSHAKRPTYAVATPGRYADDFTQAMCVICGVARRAPAENRTGREEDSHDTLRTVIDEAIRDSLFEILGRMTLADCARVLAFAVARTQGRAVRP